MSTWQIFLLGAMVVLTPSMVILALMIRHLPTGAEVPQSPENAAPFGRKYQV
jgi:hypothetical protein